MAALSPDRDARVNVVRAVAHRLLSVSVDMATDLGPWMKLNPATIESVPESPGIFEIGNLVRTVLFIGRGDGNLRRRFEGLGAVPENVPASVGGYYVRWAVVADEETSLAERQGRHQGSHDGHLPAGNEGRVRPVIRLVTRDAA